MPNRWHLYGNGIRWDVANDPRLPHEDHVEMSGRGVSLIVRYGIDRNRRLVRLERQGIWPALRHDPKDVRGYLNRTFGGTREMYQPYDGAPFDPYLTVDGEPLDLRQIEAVIFDGHLTFHGRFKGLAIRRTLLPFLSDPVFCESIFIRNHTGEPVRLEFRLPKWRERDFGCHGTYWIRARWFRFSQEAEYGCSSESGSILLLPGEEEEFAAAFSAYQGEDEIGGDDGEDDIPGWDIPDWMEKSAAHQLKAIMNEESLLLETPDPVLNRFFTFAKIRAAESIFDTKIGPVHSPGGGRYYGGVWANDQAEYAGPFFGLLGADEAREATINCYRIFASHTNPEYRRLPCSIEVEGDVLIQGRDRGDAAMIAWGASLFALSNGDEATARELWPLVEWCLEYSRRQRTPEGVIASDSDELEGRFSTGRANLCTSTLAYGGLVYGARLARALGVGEPEALEAEAAALREAIEAYFGVNVEGFETYRYHEGLETLRAWICLPLVMGILDRKEGTLEALFSPQLWTPDGLATASGDTTFWDRSTLYALQGVFAAGEADLALEKLTEYANRRLLGDHVPYPVEAWPEGGQAHLSAESALLGRVFTDGLLGIRPWSLNEFELRPSLPSTWDRVALRKVMAYGAEFDLEILREGTGWRAVVTCEGRLIEVSGEMGEGKIVSLK
ncbi:MAG: hypothetical protein ACO1SV_21345 [Fimbriimonas sp.]